MKKFSFSLQKILVYKNSVLDKEKNALSEIRLEKSSKEKEIVSLKNRLAEAFLEKDRCVMRGSSPQEMLNHKIFIDALKIKIDEAKQELSQIEEREWDQTQIVAEASRDVKRYENLKEKKLEEYKGYVIKKDQEEISEFVSSSFASKQINGDEQ